MFLKWDTVARGNISISNSERQMTPLEAHPTIPYILRCQLNMEGSPMKRVKVSLIADLNIGLDRW